ncbi:MAG: hypothetical protein ACRELY_30320, partial [Polyangiaceae bacterium]
MTPTKLRGVLVAALLSTIPACRCSSSSTSPALPTTPSAAGSAGDIGAHAPEASIDPIASFDGCIMGHDGALLDLGEKFSRRFYSRQGGGEVEDIERSGVTFARVRSRSISLTYFAGSEADVDAPTFVTLRARGGAAKSATIFVNGKSAGVVQLVKDEIAMVTAKSTQKLLAPGENEISVRFGP